MTGAEADNAGVKILPPVVLFIVVLLCIGAEIWLAPPRLALPQPAFLIFGIVVVIAGLALGGSGIRRFFALGVHPSPTRSVPRLVTGGAYRLTRNPMYQGMVIALMGVALTFGSMAFLVGAFVLFLYLSFYVVPREEAYMARKFGQDYADYCARVRRWI